MATPSIIDLLGKWFPERPLSHIVFSDKATWFGYDTKDQIRILASPSEQDLNKLKQALGRASRIFPNTDTNMTDTSLTFCYSDQDLSRLEGLLEELETHGALPVRDVRRMHPNLLLTWLKAVRRARQDDLISVHPGTLHKFIVLPTPKGRAWLAERRRTAAARTPNTDTTNTSMSTNHLTPEEHARLRGLLHILKDAGYSGSYVRDLNRGIRNWEAEVARAERMGLIAKEIMGFGVLFNITESGKAWLAIAQKPPTERHWQTQDGRRLTPAEMTAEHLFNALAFAVKNTVDVYWVNAFAQEIAKRGASIPDGAVAAKARLDELEQRLANAKAALA